MYVALEIVSKIFCYPCSSRKPRLVRFSLEGTSKQESMLTLQSEAEVSPRLEKGFKPNE